MWCKTWCIQSGSVIKLRFARSLLLNTNANFLLSKYQTAHTHSHQLFNANQKLQRIDSTQSSPFRSLPNTQCVRWSRCSISSTWKKDWNACPVVYRDISMKPYVIVFRHAPTHAYWACGSWFFLTPCDIRASDMWVFDVCSGNGVRGQR